MAVLELGTLEVRGQCRFYWLGVAEDAEADSRRESGCGWALCLLVEAEAGLSLSGVSPGGPIGCRP